VIRCPQSKTVSLKQPRERNILVTLSSLEPMAEAGLVVAVAYLALEGFRYRRDIELVAAKSHEKYESNAKLNSEDGMEHLNELKWFNRKQCNAFSPRGTPATIYRWFFRWQGDVFVISFLASVSAIILVLGVAGEAGIVGGISNRFVIVAGFLACLTSMGIPGVAVLLGRHARTWGIARVKECDRQIALALRLSAREAEPPAPDRAA